MQDNVEPQTGKVVLVIEDSPTQALHLQSLLEQAGLQVMCAWDGRMGLHFARLLNPVLIVLDVQMPELNGFEVCHQLKSASDTAHIPVIMLTHYDDPQTVMLGLEAGITDFIPKDAFSDAVLMEALRHMGLSTA